MKKRIITLISFLFLTARKTERNKSKLWYHFYFWQQGRQKETNQNSDIISILDSKEDRKKRIKTLISFLFLTARKTERNKSKLWYHFYFWQQGRQKETNQNSDIISIFDSKEDRKKQIKTLISFLFLTARKTERNESELWFHFLFLTARKTERNKSELWYHF